MSSLNTNFDLTIKPEIGLGNILFGMHIDQVIEMIGQASYQEDIEDEDCFNSIMLAYDELNINLFFEGNGASSILGDIEIENPKTILFNTKIFNLNQEQIINLMTTHGYDNSDTNFDEELKESCLSFEDAMIDFYFDNGKLTSINYGVLISNDGSIIKSNNS